MNGRRWEDWDPARAKGDGVLWLVAGGLGAGAAGRDVARPRWLASSVRGIDPEREPTSCVLDAALWAVLAALASGSAQPSRRRLWGCAVGPDDAARTLSINKFWTANAGLSDLDLNVSVTVN